MEVLSSSPSQTADLAQRIAAQLKPGDVIALHGELGAGKTTFTRFLVEALGINSRVQSPTFVIIRKYYSNSPKKIKQINHIDLYRLNSPEEVEELGLEEIIKEEKSATVIEWPQIAKDFLPDNCIKIYFKALDEKDFDPSKRKINVQNLH